MVISRLFVQQDLCDVQSSSLLTHNCKNVTESENFMIKHNAQVANEEEGNHLNILYYKKKL